MTKIGIRREDKNKWEARAPLTPENVRDLVEKEGIGVRVQPSEIRVFRNEEYEAAGAVVQEDLSECSIIFGVKEMPMDFYERGKTYVLFPHVIKGQSENMPALKRIMELGCNLVDYEKIVDENGKRLIFFGRHAGLAGMVDSLWALGERLKCQGLRTPFTEIRPAHEYNSLAGIKTHLKEIGDRIATDGLPEELTPFICAFLGYGHVSLGAQEILDCFPVEEIKPEEFDEFLAKENYAGDRIYKLVFKEKHLVEPVDPQDKFELIDYYDHPEKYVSVCDRYLPHIDILMNCIYWDDRYPRFVTKSALRKIFVEDGLPRPRVIGGISCDIQGAVECNMKITAPDNPVYVYDPRRDEISMGVKGDGPVVLAVDNLPCEIPRESSSDFGNILIDFAPRIARANYSGSLGESGLPGTIRDAVITWHGRLTPDYEYIKEYLEKT